LASKNAKVKAKSLTKGKLRITEFFLNQKVTNSKLKIFKSKDAKD